MKWTLVTGGARNIGAAICRNLAKHGFSLIIHYRSSRTAAEELAENCRRQGVEAATLRGDFSSTEGVNDFIRRYQERYLDTFGLVNNVGNFFQGTALDSDIQEWQELFQVNLYTPMQLCRALVPSIRSCHGRIVNLGCAGLQHRAVKRCCAYLASKEALLRYSCSLAGELAGDQVSVNMVSPGIMDCSVEVPQDMASIPMRRYGREDEVADAVAYLMSPSANYITGQNIEVAGGYRLH